MIVTFCSSRHSRAGVRVRYVGGGIGVVYSPRMRCRLAASLLVRSPASRPAATAAAGAGHSR